MPDHALHDNLSRVLTKVQHYRLPDAELYYWPEFIDKLQSLQLIAALEALPWQQPEIMMFGRKIVIPRRQVWMGDAHCSYRYSGVTFMPEPWTPPVLALTQQVNQALSQKFNCVLLNWYADGSQAMGWHSDDEPELGPSPQIASLSLGQPRRFDLQHKHTEAQLQLLLDDGSLLLMAGDCQQYWQHRLPKQAKATGARFNLTFRYIANGNAG